MDATYLNPWYEPHYGESPKIFRRHGVKAIFEYRGCTVYDLRSPRLGFEYVIKDVCIAIRGGFDRAYAMSLIDSILDGTNFYTADCVYSAIGVKRVCAD